MKLFPFFDLIMTFSPILDGEKHTAYIEWNFSGERWFIRIVDGTGELILNAPVIESSRELPINILQGYFTTPMIFNSSTQAFEVG